jgi:3-deoxy-manno-octulosonate cytidylyltransferase (CMP-KDO synthetase)
MSAIGIIPARYTSTRFPGKPLTPIAGTPMIQRVWDRACQAKHLSEVVIATDDERIASVCESFGAPVAMTSADHPTGTDRIAEVARSRAEDIVVNIQGDEPLIESFVIDAAVEALKESDENVMSTVVHPADDEAIHDPNRVKVVLDRSGNALYFSRSPIPFPRTPREGQTFWQHVGLYAYRRDFLLDFVNLPQTTAEQIEGLEQLRALEHGYKIRVATIDGWHSVPVDIPEDVAHVEAMLSHSDRLGD